jgi:hypothetical protein
MGIQINGQTDTISAVDGALTVSGADLPTVTNLNATGIVTATSFSGPLTGNVTGNATGLSGNPNISVSTIGVNGASPQTPIDAISNSSGNGITVRGRSADGLGNIRFTSNNYATLYGGFKHDASALTIFNELSGSLKLGTNGIDRVTIDSSGRITMPYQPAILMTSSTSGTAQTIATSTDTKITVFNSTTFSRELTWDGTNHRVTVPVTGWYQVHGKISMDNQYTMGNDDILIIRKNGSNSWITAGNTHGYQPHPWLAYYHTYMYSMVISCTANDYLELWFNQSSGSNKGIYGTMCYFYCYLIG